MDVIQPKLSRSDGVIQLSVITEGGLTLSMQRLTDGTEDYAYYRTERVGYISGLISIMEDHITINNQNFERKGYMSSEFPTSREQQAQATDIVGYFPYVDRVAEDLRVELDAARLLNLEVIPMSYDTMDDLCQLLLGLRQRIQDQDTEINQLRDRMSGPKGNQPQEPVYRVSKNDHTFL